MYAQSLSSPQRAVLAAYLLPPAKRHSVFAAASSEVEALVSAGFMKRCVDGSLVLAEGGVWITGGKARTRLEELTQVMRSVGEQLPSAAKAIPPAAAAPVRRPEPAPEAVPAPRATPAKPARPTAAATGAADPRFHQSPEEAAWAKSMRDRAMAAYRTGTTYVPASGCLLPNRVGQPARPGIGADCARWRRKILKGEPLYTVVAKAAGPSYAATLQPVPTVWEWREKSAYTAAGWGATVSDRAPLRVRCPNCERPIRLSTWWDHGCKKAIIQRDEALGAWNVVTAGAKETEYEVAA